MLKPGPLVLTTALCVFMTACSDSEPPTTPETPRYDGEWSGTTSQGRPITFTVSADQKVTAITVGYSFGSCNGTNTFSNLNLDIGTSPIPGAPQIGPGFGFGSGSPELPNYTQLFGNFSSSTAVTGSVIFCGLCRLWEQWRNLERHQALTPTFAHDSRRLAP